LDWVLKNEKILPSGCAEQGTVGPDRTYQEKKKKRKPEHLVKFKLLVNSKRILVYVFSIM
jgi:hypothetical protein